MPNVTMSRQTTLRGRPLQDAVGAMVSELGRQSPYSMIGVSSRWEDGARLFISAGNHMSGIIEIRDGSPSNVTAQVNLLSTLAQGQRARVESDMARLADRYLAASTASAPSAPQSAPRAPSAPRSAPRASVEDVLSTVTSTAEQVQHVVAGVAPGARPAAPTYSYRQDAPQSPPAWWRSPWVPIAAVGVAGALALVWVRKAGAPP